MVRFLALVAAVAACTESDPPECVPTAGGPYAVVEGEAVVAPLGCATEGELRAPAAFSIEALPAGAVLDAATATLRWTPGLDQAAVYALTVRVGEEATTGTVRIAVADAFDAPGNVPPLDPTRYPDELGLPVIFVTPRPTTEDYVAVTVTYGGHVYAAEGKLRGASSLSYPKQSYTLKFPGTDHFTDPTRPAFTDKQRIVLTSTFDDNSYVRQRLAYAVWDAMDADHVTVGGTSAVVYLDGEFHGLYLLSDHVDDELFEAHGLPTGGNVYKAINHDANFTLRTYDGDPKATLHDGYVKKDGAPADGQPGAYDDLDALVDFVATASATTFAAEIATRVHLADIRDWFVFATYVLGSDSGGKNCYLYHHPGGGPWRYAPWDWNHSFGQAWETSRTAADDWDDFANRNRLFVRIGADPVMGPALAARYRELLAGPLAGAAVVAQFDAMVAETAAVARRDWRKWGASYRSFGRWRDRTDLTDYDGEVAYTRQWLLDRAAYVERRLAP